ncbi:hypothetical protein M3D57_07000 [Corynebacterium sanguinis]|uniref:Asp23/Gls24 family envelope stress response protein n=1 Tax=Corynebacterium sanguinis TaxID=2594913 RepID=A0A6C1TUK0_9CORY|nr:MULTISPECIES: hypothetical protein [Corynebacterium]MCT1413420.1 hypothetical protein [Corynebacterium sanguinis]MCT1554615.1 hypothetical protein [Corynebacterium sanguinis]MCT1585145.1 hypothetical protein [Corynebacterium sanguinis]MCT1613278.1 hypothetical protein [Corynebacterium sanguinis]MCT1664369.1 hypothetical protein [Corynebacterium sanguinis]
MAGPITRETGEALRDAALGVPGVADLSPGRFGEVALLLPGERIRGIRAAERDELFGAEIHIVFDVGSARPIAEVATEVRAAALDSLNDPLDFIDVVVADAQKL